MSRILIALVTAVFLGFAALGSQPTQARYEEGWMQLDERPEQRVARRHVDKREFKKARELDKRRYRKAKRLLQRHREKAKPLIRRQQDAD